MVVRRAGTWTVFAAIILISSGCAMLRGPEAQINFAADRYKSVEVLYRFETAGAHQTSFTALSAPSAAGVIQSLAIKYPHPAGRVGQARVELVVEKIPTPGAVSPNPDAGWMGSFGRITRQNLPGIAFEGNVIAAWGMDVPVTQLDPIVEQLKSQGFFTATTNISRDVNLGARVNGVGGERPWVRVSELDALVVRMRKEASFVSHKGLIASSFSATPTAAAAPPSTHFVFAPTTLPAAQPTAAVAIPPAAPPAPQLPPQQAVIPVGAILIEPLPKVETTR